MDTNLRIPEVLPILPVKKTVVYPSLIGQLEVERELATRLFDAVKNGDRLLVVVAQKDAEREPKELGDVFRVGTVARIPLMQQQVDEDSQIAVLGLERVIIGDVIQKQPYLVGRIALKPDLQETQEETEALIHQLIPSFQRLLAFSQKMPESAVNPPRLYGKDSCEVVYTMAFFANMDLEHEQRLLELDIVSARIRSLHEYITAELTECERRRQDGYENSQSQHSVIEKALAAFTAADTWDETCRILESQQQLLLSEESLDALRTQIAKLREQRVARHWMIRLKRDLELLEDAYRHGIDNAKQRLEQRLKVLQNRQEVFEVFKTLAAINTPEAMINLLTGQQAELFSPAAMSVMQTLSQQLAEQNPAQAEQMQAALRLVEESTQYGGESALEMLIERTKPDFHNEIENAEEILGEYLTSATLDEAYQTLREHQDVLLSDLIHNVLEHFITQLHKAGDHRSAEKLEVHLYLLEDARARGIDSAWQAFVEDMDEEDEEDIDEDEEE